MLDQRRPDRGEGGKPEYVGYAETDPTGRYGRFNEVLGKGATKTVYKAFDEQRGMEVAWNQAKLNDIFRSPEELERLYSEVHLLSTLKHESIIQFYASWIDPRSRAINFITEMFTSGTLREYRQKYKRVDIRAVKNWARQILHGLVYLHSHDPPVIHRDLKCDNIFANGHLGQVKIGDLGFAAILRGSQPAHSVIGTPEFMAPELYEEEYNELVDVYSFGMCVLEMLTSEYPYSECSNPAQIYKKVTSGKRPEAFYRIQDPEARKFVGKCLEIVSKRLSAKELLLDPFLSEDGQPETRLTGTVHGERLPGKPLYPPVPPLMVVGDRIPAGCTDMKITGKRNPDDTIFLKVQIADKNGRIRNIHFPFDIITDTPMDVATEMVKELEITDRDASEIADVIDAEISALVPHWKDWEPHHDYCHYPDEDEGLHPFYATSSCSSSQVSLCDLPPTHSHHCRPGDDKNNWLQDDCITGDETSSQSSAYSGSYSGWNYDSGNEQNPDFCSRRDSDRPALMQTFKSSSRFCPENLINNPLGSPEASSPRWSKQSDVVPVCDPHYGHSDQRSTGNRRLSKIRSFVDVRRQLFHRSLVDEVKKLRMFKTVGAVENIGFQEPSNISSKVCSSENWSQGGLRNGKKQGFSGAKGSKSKAW